jgi:hypothetical protein
MMKSPRKNHVHIMSAQVLGVLILFLAPFSSLETPQLVQGFSLYPAISPRTTSSSSLHMAKKKGGKDSGGKGFGKMEAPPVSSMEDVAAAINKSSSGDMGKSSNDRQSILTSVEGGSSATPQKMMQIDESVPVEDRTRSILREQYGLRTAQEQEEARRREETVSGQRKKLQEWTKLADEGIDFDLMKMLPAPLLIAIDRFLKVGLAICIFLFVAAGGFIAVEAYSKTTGNPLPEDLDKFIVETIEPNFTPGLGVLLAFSVSLGAFATAQLSSASSTYREDR